MKYEYTITLKPRMYRDPPQDQFNLTSKILIDVFTGYKISCIAELTRDNNVHYHCMADFESEECRNRFINRLRRYSNMFGRRTWSQLINETAWINYLNKDKRHTKEIIKDPIVCDHFGILGDCPRFPLIGSDKEEPGTIELEFD